MNIEKLSYLNAMGIQPWLLKNKIEPSIQLDHQDILFLGEPLSAIDQSLLQAMLAAIGLENTPIAMTDISTPNLEQEIKTLGTRLIIAFGETAATALLGKDISFEEARNTVHHYAGISLIATYHPHHLRQHPLEKRKALQDLQQIQRILSNQ